MSESYFKLEWVDRHFPYVIFDIGSYNGMDALRFKEKYPNARVIAMEADKENYQKMIEDKRLKDIEVYYFAICDENGETPFYHNTGKFRGSGSIHKPTKNCFKVKGMEFGRPIKVPSTRLDTFCEKHGIKEIDIIHSDLQGAEYESLIGLGKLRPRMIFLETSALTLYENAKSPESKLIEMGYKRIIKGKGDDLWIKC